MDGGGEPTNSQFTSDWFSAKLRFVSPAREKTKAPNSVLKLPIRSCHVAFHPMRCCQMALYTRINTAATKSSPDHPLQQLLLAEPPEIIEDYFAAVPATAASLAPPENDEIQATPPAQPVILYDPLNIAAAPSEGAKALWSLLLYAGGWMKLLKKKKEGGVMPVMEHAFKTHTSWGSSTNDKGKGLDSSREEQGSGSSSFNGKGRGPRRWVNLFSCLGIQIVSKSNTSIDISDVYNVEFIDWGLVHETLLTNPGLLLGHSSEMYRFTVHGVERSKSQPSLWAPTVYTFGHVDKQTCLMWVNKMKTFLSMETDRPKTLLVYVHPGSGKGDGCRTWESLAPIFSQAKVKTKVIVTERAGHAFEAMTSMTNRELNLYDGIVAVGGDGFFNEIINGILLSRHRAPYPPPPPDDDQTVEAESDVLLHDPTVTVAEPLVSGEDESAVLLRSPLDQSQAVDLNQDSEMSFPNERFRFGLIPAGSTDAIVICTTGVRDPMTSALQIILGKRIRLDIAQVVRWEKSRKSKNEPLVRYAASFAGYGFYGDVITESEKYRWMGPKRYDYAGTKVFLRHRVGDGPIAGSSSYADDEVGACGATGDGDIMMRFLPCYQVVESMRLGMEPRVAAKDAISRIARKYPTFVGAIFAVDKNGVHAGACHGWTFQYSVRSPSMDDVEVFTVYPV